MKASYKIVKRLFCLNYTSQKYHRSVSNVAMVLVAAVALGSSTYAWFVTNNKVDATTTNISAQSNVALGDVTAGADTLVNVYLYYEGKDTNVKTRNLQDGKLDASQSVKINFTATADNQ